jgi:N-acetylglucosaminyldiphosphoundecaprenol N-acetyl-beta-D-mannosaminyltransferase
MKVDILGIKIDKITNSELAEKLEEFMNSGVEHYIITANPEIIVEAQKDIKFHEIINNADLTIPDGFGLLLASRFLSGLEKLSERITGVDLVYKTAKILAENPVKRKVFFLGAREGAAKAAAEKLKKIFSGLEFAGTFSGDGNEKGDRVAVSIINQAKPDILFVAYGAPKQEKWIARNLKKMPSVRLAIGVGGAFDIISGRIRRAPQWTRKAGLEWLWRLIQEPRRIGRIYNATVKFASLIIVKRLSE